MSQLPQDVLETLRQFDADIQKLVSQGMEYKRAERRAAMQNGIRLIPNLNYSPNSERKTSSDQDSTPPQISNEPSGMDNPQPDLTELEEPPKETLGLTPTPLTQEPTSPTTPMSSPTMTSSTEQVDSMNLPQ